MSKEPHSWAMICALRMVEKTHSITSESKPTKKENKESRKGVEKMTESMKQVLEAEKAKFGKVINEALEDFSQSREYLAFKIEYHKLSKLDPDERGNGWLKLNSAVDKLYKNILVLVNAIKETLKMELVVDQEDCSDFFLEWQSALETILPEFFQRMHA